MRECKECTLCCTLCHVPELSKIEGQTCKHCNRGCLIYKARPASCASYKCAWLKNEVPESMRPDICGVMIEVHPLMVAVLLKPGQKLYELSQEVLTTLDQFVSEGKPVIATGQFAKLPIGMTGQQAKDILVQTVKEYRNGG